MSSFRIFSNSIGDKCILIKFLFPKDTNIQTISPAMPTNVNNQSNVTSQSNANQIGSPSFSTSPLTTVNNQFHANTLILATSNSSTNSSAINLLPIQISSPNNIKNKFHKKKPSQSSLLSTQTNINNSIQNVANLHSNSSQLLTNSSSNINQPNNESSNASNLQNEDIEIMKQRSANNNTFLCIK